MNLGDNYTLIGKLNKNGNRMAVTVNINKKTYIRSYGFAIVKEMRYYYNKPSKLLQERIRQLKLEGFKEEY